MIRIITLLSILACVGCQTVPTQEKNETTPSKEVVTVLVEKYDNHGFKITKSNPEPYGKKFLKLNADGTIVQGQDESSLFEYKITVKWSEFKPDGTEDVLTSPMLTGKPNKWSTLRVGTPPPNLNSTISFLIEGEKIELQTVYGVSLTSKVVPSVEQTVQAKGMIAISKKGKSGKLIRKSVPFNVNCNLNETITVYETEIKLEPAS